MNEVPLSQCDKCGSELPEDEIDWEMRYHLEDVLKAAAIGTLVGFIIGLLLMAA